MIHLLLCALVSSDFRSDVEAAGAAYDAVKSRTEKPLDAGDLVAAQKAFLDAVPEDKRTAAHWFVLGNLWFDMDTAFSMRMHEKAFALAPDEPLVQREWALELHRAGKHAQAEPLYAKLAVGDEEEAQVAGALRADCLLAMGKHAEAAAAWADARKTKSAHVSHVFDWVYGPESKITARSRMLADVKAGKLGDAEKLVLADCFWKPEGNRYFLKYEYMTNDTPIVIEKLGKDSARAADLEAIVDYLFIDWEQRFPRSEDAVPRKELEESAKKRGWLGDAPKLPADDRVAAAVVDALRDQGLGTPEKLLSDFGADLANRAKAPSAPPEVAQALIRLARKAKSDKLDEYKRLAKPDATETARDAVDAARKAKQPVTELLVAQIRAELRDKKPDLGVLDKAFAELGTASAK
jgi:hypothetical protein